MSDAAVGTAAAPIAVGESSPRLRLAVRGFLAAALLLTITITATSTTQLYNTAIALRQEAEASAVNLSELLSASFAEIGEISLANVARTLDATLDGQMIAQARLTANMVAAAEAAGMSRLEVIALLESVVAQTVLDEFWITDESAFAYLTNVRDPDGELVPFAFDPDPTVQPQASKFYVLLASPLDGGDVITQPHQVREIDQQVYKYVGVGGVDKPRIVQVGNALNFGEQEILTNVYASQRADVSAVIEGILGQQMVAQATILDRFIYSAELAEWDRGEIEERLRRIVDTTVIGEIRVTDHSGAIRYSSLSAALAEGPLPHDAELGLLRDGTERIAEHAAGPRPTDGAAFKYVTIAGQDTPQFVQVGLPIEGSDGNLLYSVYQSDADVYVRSRNLEALWVVNLNREIAAAAPRPGMQTDGSVTDARAVYGQRAEAVMAQAMDEGRVVSEATLALLSPADRGLWVASPIINAGGIQIGGLAIAVSLDEIVETVFAEVFSTTLIALVLLGGAGAGALWGTRWLTRPIEVIADAAREVESGRPPDKGAMREVVQRQDELGSLARVFNDMTVQVFMREEQLETLVSERTQELQTSNQQLRLAQDAMEQDLEMAKVVQHALVREGNVQLDAFFATARMTPAQAVGGDLVDMVELPNSRFCLVLGDVSGKGVAASLFMAAAHSAIKTATSKHDDAGAVVAEANNRLCSQNPMGFFVTGVVALVDLKANTVDYVCAGHDSPVVVDQDGECRVIDATGGLAMGVMDGMDYDSRRITLQPGETLFLFTDGLTDAVNLQGDLYGKERLDQTFVEAAALAPEDLIDHVWRRIADFSAGAPVVDDMTCLVLKRT